MNFFTRAANGWQIAKGSFNVLKANRSLLLFPFLSGLSLILVLSFIIAGIIGYQPSGNNLLFAENKVITTILIFIYYLVNYFIIIFFNTALSHCICLYFNGQEVSIKKGMAHSFKRLPAIFSWAVFAATVGTILNLVQENFGIIGRIITGLIGVVFNIAAFFVVPVLACENSGPINAFRRSASLMKDKWGETAGAKFHFGFIQFIAVIFIAIIAFTIGTITTSLAGVIFAVLAILFLVTVTSAAKAIFMTTIYRNITGDPVDHYEQHFIDHLFTGK